MPYVVVRPLKLRILKQMKMYWMWTRWQAELLGEEGRGYDGASIIIIIIMAKYVFWIYSIQWLCALAPLKCPVKSDGPAPVRSVTANSVFMVSLVSAAVYSVGKLEARRYLLFPGELVFFRYQNLLEPSPRKWWLKQPPSDTCSSLLLHSRRFRGLLVTLSFQLRSQLKLARD